LRRPLLRAVVRPQQVPGPEEGRPQVCFFFADAGAPMRKAPWISDEVRAKLRFVINNDYNSHS